MQQNQMTLTVPVLNAEQAAAIMAIVSKGGATGTTASKPSKTEGKPGKPSKQAAKTETLEDDFGEEETSEIDVSDLRETTSDDPADFDESEDFDDAEAEDADAKIDDKQLKTLQAALNAHSSSKKNKEGKAATVKILKKFAPASRDVKAKDLPALLKALKV